MSTVIDVPERGGWLDAIARARDEGWRGCDGLTAIDHGDELSIVAILRGPAGVRLLVTRIPADDPQVDSAAALLPAVVWHEREVAEMFGVRFVGLPDPRPLLLRDHVPAPPLRRSTPLPERVARPWPGAREPGERRRPTPPPGVRASWAAAGTEAGV